MKKELKKEAVQMLTQDDSLFMEMISYLDFDYKSIATEGFRCYWMSDIYEFSDIETVERATEKGCFSMCDNFFFFDGKELKSCNNPTKHYRKHVNTELLFMAIVANWQDVRTKNTAFENLMNELAK